MWGEDIAGGSIDLTGKPQKWERNHGQFWVLADQMLIRNGSGASDGLILLGGYVHSDPAVVSREDQAYVGLYDKNFWSKRPQDIIGLLYTHQTMSGRLSGEQALEAQQDLPLANTATGVQRCQDLARADRLTGLVHDGGNHAILRRRDQERFPVAVFCHFLLEQGLGSLELRHITFQAGCLRAQLRFHILIAR